MKRTPLKRGTKQMKRSGFKVKTAPPLKKSMAVAKRANKRRVRTKLPTVKSMRNKCDALLTPIIKKMYPYCLLTGQPTEVAHHHVKKSESSALRYYLPNLIPLTHKAHMALHSHETLYSSRIVAIRGVDWWNDLEEKKREFTKCDVHFYIENHARLLAILESL